MKKPTLPKDGWLCGIERDKDSPAFGDTVCPDVFLWRFREGRRTRVIGRLPHGQKVRVMMSAPGVDGRTYFYVGALGYTGWVSAPFISWKDVSELVFEDL